MHIMLLLVQFPKKRVLHLKCSTLEVHIDDLKANRHELKSHKGIGSVNSAVQWPSRTVAE